ncbi:hypothetical protein AB0J55_20455 [Amycolatopsis sp. NPDC049688]|uniref:hypothetical protein n=1 Tax=Amycolatopsis sp. NPDC049688 TaxID=3154733 RepID=UPI0034196B77
MVSAGSTTAFEATVTALAGRQGRTIVLLVLDGLGGYRTAQRASELATARTPNLDELAATGALGLHDPVRRGITPGSGAGHLGLFGYDPLRYRVGRGTFTAAGLGVELVEGDVVARANICTLSENGDIADRRAGRMSGEEAATVCDLVNEQSFGDVEVRLVVEMGHRALLLLRGAGLNADVADTDPQRTGVPPLAPAPLSEAAVRTAETVDTVLARCRKVLAHRQSGNFLLLRGFDTRRELPPFPQRYQVRAAALATYPMYQGIARLLGFETHHVRDLAAAVQTLPELLRDGVEFVYVHVETPDLAGEDGDFGAKQSAIEAVDALVPAIRASGAEVLAVTGDHATPAQLSAHSWHPVPVLVHGGTAPADGIAAFDEVSCRRGSLGRFPAYELMPQLLAAAGRLAKFDGQRHGV